MPNSFFNKFFNSISSKVLRGFLTTLFVGVGIVLIVGTAFVLLQLMPYLAGKLEYIFSPRQIGATILTLTFIVTIVTFIWIFKSKK